ncbi:glutaminyl-tRNA synthetase [Blumeria hordei DH14]|uniref:glutamine--tRNA ligase n=1 Tax=Blumeria graminis f. sp. hordei (strain DH14) TaxID=546991 RepID=N1J6L7_BLUG1|nr:glutaminyl-tRNA synthetase [Blumeria hordei DH14]
MADAPTASMAKLQLDEMTGEMVSKGELKKRNAKRAKKLAQAKFKSDVQSQPPKVVSDKTKVENVDKANTTNMFSHGWLDEVYKERPVKPVTTRFPPEPNGYLHIGHAKAIAVNFGFAKFHGGDCYLRFDDTNPEAEEEKYFIAIQELIEWLGFKPCAVTYSSDNFDKLYEKAEELIQLQKAYICSCEDAEIKAQRGGDERGPRFRCAHADQSIEYNLTEFRAMRDGKYRPREAFLRMKQDIEDGNPQMWDLAAYRVLDAEHHRTGSKWKIYPTYDFTHCLCDSFEKITHSLCTTEFIQSRVSYEWLNKTLKVYEPMQREYGRLSIAGTVLSKRKIMKLVNENYVRGWDDPRLYTLSGIRRRGVPPGAILEFVNEIGVTTAPTIIQMSRFDQTIRRYLEQTVPRLMLVLDPLPVTIEDAEEMELELPFSPKIPAMGTHKVNLTKTIYIERTDFREVDSKDYFRLAPGKSVGLLQVPFPIKAISFTKEGQNITSVLARYDKEGKKPKTYIHWVSSGSQNVEVRLHNALFKSEKPEAAEGGFLNDINPDSEKVWTGALIESGFDEVRNRAPWPKAAGESNLGKGRFESIRFQAMRVAYMTVDSDSTDDKIILNRIVSLKEDSSKDRPQ